jgi:hypothetical protein
VQHHHTSSCIFSMQLRVDMHYFEAISDPHMDLALLPAVVYEGSAGVYSIYSATCLTSQFLLPVVGLWSTSAF